MKTKSSFKVIGLVLAVVVLVFGGIGITGAAAQSTIPGDALYPVKTTIESTRLSLAQDAGNRAQMNLAFADQRLGEIRSLISEGRVLQIRKAVLAFEAHINTAIIELETVSASDPARAAAIAQEVLSALTRYAQTLSDLAAVAPDSIKPEVIRALDTTQIATGLGRSARDDNANGNDNESVDDLIDDNGNDNMNDNDDTNVNGNGNSNANDNAGFDDNGNDNGNDNSNMNANDNGGDDNSNDTVDDNGNDNGNSNDDNGGGSGNDNSGDDNGGGSGNDNSGDDNGGGSDDNGNDDNGGHGSDD